MFSGLGQVNTVGTRTAVATDDGFKDNFWDADDMTMEMVTDINDGDIDEDVRTPFFLPIFSVRRSRC
jgi:pyrimidine and pyridine-specific 5'-nucleotidase